MTNAEKYLKDNASVEEMRKDFFDYLVSDGVYGCNSKNIVQKWEDFLNTPTKPQLTEDERVILRNIDKRWKNIYRNSGGGLELHEIYLGEEQMMIFYSYNHLFQFIKERRRILY